MTGDRNVKIRKTKPMIGKCDVCDKKGEVIKIGKIGGWVKFCKKHFGEYIDNMAGVKKQ